MTRGVTVGLVGVLFAGCGLFPSLDGLTGGSDALAPFDASDATTPRDAGDASIADDRGDALDADGMDAGPDVAPDAMDGGAVTAPVFVASNQDGTPNTATSFPISISTTGAGHMLVVTVTQESGISAIITGISDDASNVYTNASQRSVDSNCWNTAEIWYAANVQAGAHTVTVTMSAAVAFEVWVAEFSGVTALDTGATANSQPTGATIAAPVVSPSVANALIVSVATSCGTISAVHAGNPFVGLPIVNGEDTAYYVAPNKSSYGAVWDYSGGTWNASTVAFR